MFPFLEKSKTTRSYSASDLEVQSFHLGSSLKGSGDPAFKELLLYQKYNLFIRLLLALPVIISVA